MTPFDLDVSDRDYRPPREEMSARERLLRMLPSLTTDQVESLVHEGEEMIRARRSYHQRLAAEERALRLVGPERQAFLDANEHSSR